MKIILKIAIVLFLVTLIPCCNKDKTQKSKPFLTAKIDGVNYSFNDKVDLNGTKEISHIINGFNEELKTRIMLGLNLENQKTGTFELKHNTVLVYHSHNIFKGKRIRYIWHAKESVIGSSGTITIIKNTDAYIEGTFSFNGVGAVKVDTSIKKITEGKFKVLK